MRRMFRSRRSRGALASSVAWGGPPKLAGRASGRQSTRRGVPTVPIMLVMLGWFASGAREVACLAPGTALRGGTR